MGLRLRDAGDVKDAEGAEDAECVENADDAEGVEDAEDAEVAQRAERAEVAQRAERAEVAQATPPHPIHKTKNPPHNQAAYSQAIFNISTEFASIFPRCNLS